MAGSGTRTGAAAESRWHYRRSIASRVTLLTTIAVGLSLTAIAVGVYVVLRIQLQETTDDSLTQRARSAASQIDRILVTYPTATIPTWVVGAGDVRIAVIEPDGRVRIPDLADGFPRLGDPEWEVMSGERAMSIRTISTEDGSYRVVTVPADGRALVIAQSMTSINQMYAKLGLVMLVFLAVGVVVAGFAGWGVAKGGLRPVRRLTTDVERVARTQNLDPIPVEGDDEIASLASSFNEVLVALAASRDRQQQLVADASHELRTPLTSLRTNIDLLTQAGDNLEPQQRTELLGDVRAQMDELTTLIGDLVELARDEAPDPVPESIALPEIVESAMTRVRLRAPGLQFEAETTPWWLVGDSSALERAITNLLDNAAKWSPEDGTVRIRLAVEDGPADGTSQAILTVDDEGPGIDEADQPHVFDRFYRSTESRAMPGSGLGLAIVRQVVTRHSGSVEAGRAPGGGARLTVRLPGSATAPAAPTDPPTGDTAP